MKSLQVLIALLVAAPAFAKPLYVTVPRSFGPTEQAQLEVSFAEKEAVELRVLKPKNLQTFIKAQQALHGTEPEDPLRVLDDGLHELIGTTMRGDRIGCATEPFRAYVEMAEGLGTAEIDQGITLHMEREADREVRIDKA